MELQGLISKENGSASNVRTKTAPGAPRIKTQNILGRRLEGEQGNSPEDPPPARRQAKEKGRWRKTPPPLLGSSVIHTRDARMLCDAVASHRRRGRYRAPTSGARPTIQLPSITHSSPGLSRHLGAGRQQPQVWAGRSRGVPWWGKPAMMDRTSRERATGVPCSGFASLLGPSTQPRRASRRGRAGSPTRLHAPHRVVPSRSLG
jgi:hypothetical protein